MFVVVAVPSSAITWIPAATAVISSRPSAPVCSASARAAGTTTDEVCQARAWASSYSQLWPNVPLTYAAWAALAVRPPPVIVLGPDAGISSASRRTGRTLDRVVPSTCTPSWSRITCSTRSTTSAGRSS
jgi:hypothetical protein